MNHPRLYPGIAIFWLTWPLLRLTLHGTERTRVLIRSGNRIAVVKNRLGDHKWSLPGGGMHAKESALACAIREVHEELGLNFKVHELTALGREELSNRGISIDCHYFTAQLKSAAPLKRQIAEISEVAWVDPLELSADNADMALVRALWLEAERSSGSFA